MKRSFSLAAASSAALVLIASALALPMQANAADRQIVPTAKIKSFTVQDTAEAGATEVAANPEVLPPRRKKAKAFRVEENNEQANTGSGNIEPKSFRVEEETEQAEAGPKLKPKRPAPPKIQEFRVDEETGEVADTPTVETDEEDVATTEPAPEATRPAKKLKPAKIAEQAIEPEVSEDEQAAAIADDSAEAPAEDVAEAAVEEEDDEPTILRKVSKVHKVKRYKRYQSYDGVQDDYAYQPSAYGSSCNQNYSY